MFLYWNFRDHNGFLLLLCYHCRFLFISMLLFPFKSVTIDLNNLLIFWLTDWLTDWLAGWLTGWLAGWLTDWLADWLTDWGKETKFRYPYFSLWHSMWRKYTPLYWFPSKYLFNRSQYYTHFFSPGRLFGKVFVFGFILSHIFPHSDWIRRDTSYLSVFSPNVGKCWPE